MKYVLMTLLMAGVACNSVVREDDDASDGDGGAGANHSSSTGDAPDIETCREYCQLICPARGGDCAAIASCDIVDDTYYMQIGCYEEMKALWECSYRDRECDPDSPNCCAGSCNEQPLIDAYYNCLHNSGGVTGVTVSASSSSGGT